jgi:hypothetical protein
MLLRNVGGHLPELHGFTTQETVLFTFTAVTKPNSIKNRTYQTFLSRPVDCDVLGYDTIQSGSSGFGGIRCLCVQERSADSGYLT